MYDNKKRAPRPARATENIPAARQIDEHPFDEHRNADRPRYAGYVSRETGPAEKPFSEERRFQHRPVKRPVQAEELPENMLVGRNPIREALKAGAPVEKLLIAEGYLSGVANEIIALAKNNGVVVQKVQRSRLDEIYSAHQGMLAYVAQAEYSTVEEILSQAEEKNEEPFIVILDGITDPYNLGAIIRSAECAGAHGVIIPERHSSGLTPTVAKAAAGSLAYMKVARVGNINRTIDELKERGVWICAAALDGENAFEADLSGPIAIVIGSEGDGISRLTLEKCDRRLTLPMKGHIDSLNASVASGILLYQVMRRRP